MQAPVPLDPAPASAPAGHDLDDAERLLERTKREGTAAVGLLTRQALRRWLAHGAGPLQRADQLFSAAELQQLADALAAVNAAAELLGRARVQLRAERAEKRAGGAESFADAPSLFAVFDDAAEPLKPFAPAKAVDYFRSLIPRLKVNVAAFVGRVKERAFTLAYNTGQTILDRIKGVIADALETGQGVSASPRVINRLLTAAGVTPQNPQYGEMVVRTQMMSAYNQGAHEEMQEVADSFPAWRYEAIVDERSRPHHAARDGKLYPASVRFEEVRGEEAKDVCNCRCTFTPVHRLELQALQRGGKQVETSW